MENNSFIPFLILIYLIIFFFDYVTLRNWHKLAKRRDMPKWTYIVPWAIGGAMVVNFIYLGSMRFFEVESTMFQKVLYAIAMVWYLPKVVIAPAIGIKELFLLIKRFVRRRILKRRDDRLDMKKVASRRKFIQNAGWSMAGVPFVIVGHGIMRTTHDFRVAHVDVGIDNLPPEHEGLRIVQFSDIHAGSFFTPRPFERAVNIANNLDADIFIATGDFVNFDQAEYDLISHEFSRVRARYGKFGCLGNHDHYMIPSDHRLLVRKIRESGINLLINENLKIDIKGKPLQLAGTDNTGHRLELADFDLAIEGLSEDEPIYLMCHDPTNWDRSIVGQHKVDLMLAGHTHGGQVKLGAFGVGISGAQFVYKQWAGLYETDGQQLYVNRGLGTVGPPVRVGIPPEITLITLRRREDLEIS
ncbi:MAG: metallophosphoesterase [Candidatus Kapaibacterium sp.]